MYSQLCTHIVRPLEASPPTAIPEKLPQPRPHLLSQPLRIPNRRHSTRRGRLLTCMPPRWPLALRIHHPIRHHQRTFCRTLLCRNSWHRSQPLRGGVPCPRPLRQRCYLLSSICLRYRVSSAPSHHHFGRQPARHQPHHRPPGHSKIKAHRPQVTLRQVALLNETNRPQARKHPRYDRGRPHQKSQPFQISLVSQPTLKYTRYPTIAPPSVF